MADNPPPAESNRADGDGEANGNKGKRSWESRPRGNGGDRSRGGRGRGGGRGGDRGRGRGRGGGRGFGSKEGGRESRGEMGRGEYNRGNVDKRQRNNEEQAAKRRKLGEDGEESHPFTKEELEAEKAEGRKPKRKVAVLIGYAGTGYKGMQINGDEKTIEGDIFKAFIAAGAISKVNADDPKKSSLVRCARTDKGVHAAGNVISLKLIVEDPDIVTKINDALPPQIRVWGFERTNGAFSCYQTCDSRWYEYLIPTFAFIPPHPQSYLGKKLEESAEKEGIYETYESLQEDIASFWPEAEEKYIRPVLDKLDPELREQVLAAIHKEESTDPEGAPLEKKVKAADKPLKDVKKEGNGLEIAKDDAVKVEEEPSKDAENGHVRVEERTTNTMVKTEVDGDVAMADNAAGEAASTTLGEGTESAIPALETTEPEGRVIEPLEAAIREVKAAYIVAKKAYRISDVRKRRVQEALQWYLGTRNFHNYTIQKHFSDPSSKRVIKSFDVNPTPVYINDTEWLSLKVHGQSFMMHQIRKMIGMASLAIRCGTRLNIIPDSFGPTRLSIPKAPGLGLLLERPVFRTYNERAVKEYQREEIDFDKFTKEMDEFKQREIYDRIFREEERDRQFMSFYHHIDNFRSDRFLWLTAAGLAAAAPGPAKGELKRKIDPDETDDELPDAKGEEG